MSKALQAAINLISNPSRWTKDAVAQDCDGETVDSVSRKAVRWSAWGAMEKKSVSGLMQRRVDAYCRLVFKEYGGLTWSNDGPDGHRRVLRAMRAVKRGWKL